MKTKKKNLLFFLFFICCFRTQVDSFFFFRIYPAQFWIHLIPTSSILARNVLYPHSFFLFLRIHLKQKRLYVYYTALSLYVHLFNFQSPHSEEGKKRLKHVAFGFYENASKKIITFRPKTQWILQFF
ncbi:hypothetical protein HMI56_000158 [Coelomomyces lativittatus]|nr:hypothetical protein HMI56_000158 [Coelomomyces lativittatus]